MINKNGQTIAVEEKSYDKEFALKEIKFFMKGFSVEPNDDKAHFIAEKIYEYVEKDGSIRGVNDTLPYIKELEEYIPATKNDDFVWQLVYTRRKQDVYYKNNFFPDLKKAAEAKYISAKHFEYICKITPTERNKTIRAYEYMGAALRFREAKNNLVNYNKEISEICDRVEKLLPEINETDSTLYYDSYRLLYAMKYYMEIDEKEIDTAKVVEYIKKYLYYTREMYIRDKYPDFYAKNLTHFYEIAESINGFSTKEELEALERLCEVIQMSMLSEEKDIAESLENLKKIKEKIRKAVCS